MSAGLPFALWSIAKDAEKARIYYNPSSSTGGKMSA